MKRTIIDELKFNDNGELVSVKGHLETVKVVIEPNFNNCFEDRTLKVMFWEQFADDDKDFYCGG